MDQSTLHLQSLFKEMNSYTLDHFQTMEASVFNEKGEEEDVSLHYQSATDLSKYVRPKKQPDAEKAKDSEDVQSSTDEKEKKSDTEKAKDSENVESSTDEKKQEPSASNFPFIKITQGKVQDVVRVRSNTTRPLLAFLC